MKKNDNITLTINNYGCNAEGVGIFDGQVVFVPYSVVNETIDATIIKKTSKVNLAKIINIQNKVDDRIEPLCPYFTKCGGCQLQHINYQKTLQIKTQIVQDAITKIGKIEYQVLPCVECETQYHYRNKLATPINPKTKCVGMYRPESHNIIDIKSCPLQNLELNKLIETFNQYLKLTKNSIYDEQTHRGLIKSLVARQVNDILLVTVVINGNELDDSNLLIDLLKTNFEKVGLGININKLNNNVILTENFKHIWGFEKAEIKEYEIEYQINNQSFFQVNNEIKHKIYDQIFKEIQDEIVIDAYSGAGLLSAMMAKHASKVFGIEIIKPATESANQLAKQNNITNLTNINGDCAEKLPELLSSLSNQEKDNLTIVIDPPRKGCDKKVIESIVDAKPSKIIYLSCNPSTLARDLNLIMQSGLYSIKCIQPFDMFPQTKHVETLAILKIN